MGVRDLVMEIGAPRSILAVIEGEARFLPMRGKQLEIRVAVNREWASLSTEVMDGDEVALVPPTSGG